MSENHPGLLDRIVATKQKEVQSIDRAILETGELPAIPSFYNALKRGSGEPLRVIAECKKASPTKGLIRADYIPGEIAKEYARLGASAISVLTDREYFQGDLAHILPVRESGLPVIRKDFIISPLQIKEARLAGASAVLLIVRILSKETLKTLLEYSHSQGLDVLVEVHNEAETRTALETGARIIGVNHRDLDTLKMDLTLSGRMGELIRKERADAIVVAESGIENRQGRMMMEDFADAILIGSALMESSNLDETWDRIFKN